MLHVLDLCYNLLSVQELCKAVFSLAFVEDKFLVWDKHKKVLLEGVLSIGYQ